MDQQHNVGYDNAQQQQQQQQQPKPSLPNSNNSRHGRKPKPCVKIIEQPASKALRFRYECEGRSAGSIPGVNSTSENKTYPTIEIVGYKGRAVVVVSCVTKDEPYRPHPHNLVGKEGCKKGVCTIEINSETMRTVFSNLGIQCVKKKDIEAALKAREEIRVDPFKTGFQHRFQPASIDLNSVRLCFQVFMEGEQKGRFTQPLPPVVSEPIYDKKAMSDLVICRLCSCSASVLGNNQIILLCEKVAKEDISIRFFEEKDDQIIWEAYGDFQHTDVHKQTAITFKTPRYHKLDITEPVKVFIQLKRPSDGITSEALPFQYVPLDSGRHRFWDFRRNLKRKPDLDIFQQILNVDREIHQTTVTSSEIIDLNTPTADEEKNLQTNLSDIETTMTMTNTPKQAVTENRDSLDIDSIIEEKVRELEQQQVLTEASINPSQEIPTNITQNELKSASGMDTTVTDQIPSFTVTDKINQWMKSNEFQSNSNQDGTNNLLPTDNNQEDKTLDEILEQVAELDEIYSDRVTQRDSYNNDLLNELNGMDTCIATETNRNLVDGSQTAMEIDESFDDAATYTSLQIAFKNPITIPMDDLIAENMTEPVQHYDPVDVRNSLAASSVRPQNPQPLQSPPRPPAPTKLASPYMHVTAAEEEKVPPLPPKRLRKQDSNAENRSIEANIGDTSNHTQRQGPPSIIIMKTPDQSAPTKRLPPKPDASNCNVSPKQKKPGFFSKLFSRRKSKSDIINHTSDQVATKSGSKTTSPSISGESSFGNFHLNDPNRSSIRSAKSLQPSSLPTSPLGKSAKVGKPVGRSVSSVSGKRPAHLNADVIHIPLRGDSTNSLPQQEDYSKASTLTLSNTLDRKTVSALQLADIPICEGNMELVAIADRQSLRNLCEGEFNVQLDPNVDLTEAEHYALYTSVPPQATVSEFDETSAYYAPVDGGEILTPEELAERLVAANRIN
uniref:RHD domain-containing protein n=1 Tax=Glossina brevipalpis TaxID=37001 RepID=A0A1A9WBI7_9MUSC